MDKYIFVDTESVLGFDGCMSGISNSDLSELSAKLEEAGLNPFNHIYKYVGRDIDYDYYPLFKARQKYTNHYNGMFSNIAFNNELRHAYGMT